MTRSLVVLGLLAAAAPACPPRWVVWCPPPVVVWTVPCCPVAVAAAAAPVAAAPAKPPVAMPATPPATAKADPAPVKPAAPQVVPEAAPFKPAGGDKPMEPLTLPKMEVPNAPPPTPKPADLKLPDQFKPATPNVTPDLPVLPLPTPKETKTSFRLPDPRLAVRVVPQAGSAPAGDRRRAVFVNLTGGPVRLTVDGETTTLPARHELAAAVGASFRWRLDDGESRTDAVPADAPGVDVVLR